MNATKEKIFDDADNIAFALPDVITVEPLMM